MYTVDREWQGRHLGTLTPHQFERLMDHIRRLLKEHNCAGSIGSDYSLFAALDAEYQRARASRHGVS
jgi:hypothetical protein